MFKWRENGNDRSRKGKVYACNYVLDLSTYAAVMMKWEKTFSLEQELPWTTSHKMRQGTGCFLPWIVSATFHFSQEQVISTPKQHKTLG